MTASRALLLHFLAALAYRTQKALRGAPSGFGDFHAGSNVRTPYELLWHMTGVIGYARTFVHGGEFAPPRLATLAEEEARFHATLEALRTDLSGDSLRATISDEQFLQGPLADAMTHAGQLAMLRRLAQSPVASENFIYAPVSADNVSADQPAPAAPDAWWHPDLPSSPPGPERESHADLAGMLAFAAAAERLKDTTRSGWTSTGRQDTVAAHTWRLCLMALVFHPSFPGLDLARLLAICIVHDLGEAIHGDIPAPEQGVQGSKSAAERNDLVQFLTPLPGALRDRFLALWDEYEAAVTPEAQLAKALDKLETILQHNQGANPPGFDYAFNLDYGRTYTDGHPLLAALRAELDAMTSRRAQEREAGPGLP